MTTLPTQDTPNVILASSSPYRRTLLQRLAIRFRCEAPHVDERPMAGESASDMVVRLALAKAQTLAKKHPNHIVIGSDQTAVIGDRILGKPGSPEQATAQLRTASGLSARFYTAIAVLSPERQPSTYVDCTKARFRTLSDLEISRYIALEKPFDCAGSFKCEALGIALFDAIESNDPTALMGLPLIAVARLLRAAGLTIP